MDGLDARLARFLGSGDVDELYDLGYDLAEAGRPADARRCFEEAAARGSTVASFGLGNVLRGLGLLDEALDAFTTAVEGGEEDARLKPRPGAARPRTLGGGAAGAGGGARGG